MKRFTTFLKEEQESHMVLSYGRFQPPHQGHNLVVQKTHELAEQYNADHRLILSAKHGGTKNPLDPDTKLEFAKCFWPTTKIELATAKHPGVVQQAERFQGQNTHLHVVAGQDRVAEYQRLLDHYVGNKYKSITVHSSGDRNSASDGTIGLSATKMRQLAKEGKWSEFKSNLPDHRSDMKPMFEAVRKGLGIKEEITGKALFLTGGPGSGKDIVIRPILKLATEIAPNQLFDTKTKTLLELHAPIIINGACANIEASKNLLESYGYETIMVFVWTSNEESQKRNEARQGRGRVINEKTRYGKWLQANNSVPLYESLFDNMNVLNNNSYSESYPTLINEIKDFFEGTINNHNIEYDVNKAFSKTFLNELFGQGYPITPDDQKPENKENNIDYSAWKAKAQKAKKPGPTGQNFKSSVGKNNSVQGTGPGREFSIRGSEGSAPAGGIGDPVYREEMDSVSPNFGGMGSSNSEPMVTPGEKIIDQMTSSGSTTKKKKTFKDIRGSSLDKRTMG